MTGSGDPDGKRPIGMIFLERGHISEEQLALALQQQQATGEKLGEILVASFGVSRLDLASALAERWDEEKVDSTPAASPVTPPAADARLEQRTPDLELRLAAVETLLAALVDAIEELRRPATPPTAARAKKDSAKVAAPLNARKRGDISTNDILKQLSNGPRTTSELREALGTFDDNMLHRAVADGLINPRSAMLDGSPGHAGEEYHLTPAGAIRIGEDPDGHPWPFRT